MRCASDVALWYVPAEDLRALAERRPELLLEVGARVVLWWCWWWWWGSMGVKWRWDAWVLG